MRAAARRRPPAHCAALASWPAGGALPVTVVYYAADAREQEFTFVAAAMSKKESPAADLKGVLQTVSGLQSRCDDVRESLATLVRPDTLKVVDRLKAMVADGPTTTTPPAACLEWTTGTRKGKSKEGSGSNASSNA